MRLPGFRVDHATVNFCYLIPLTALMLVACNAFQPTKSVNSPDSPQWRQHEEQLRQLTQYQIQGTFAYFEGKQKIYARFFLQQYSHERYRLLLTNPLGGTVFELAVAPGLAQLTGSQGNSWFSDNPQTLLQELTGISIPLNELRQWILGLPGSASKITLNSQYRLTQLSWQQQEKTWTVDYQEYNSQKVPPLPSKLELKQDQRRIKLKMDNWTVK